MVDNSDSLTAAKQPHLANAPHIWFVYQLLDVHSLMAFPRRRDGEELGCSEDMGGGERPWVFDVS
ncbi:hypothetical protein NQZ68_032231 [Dissostichus eleginoides]|nr:hypothetical protein NQZ68_032231 [Dissostichus eleginoides]